MKLMLEERSVIDIQITEDGFYQYEIKNCRKSQLHIHIDKRRRASLFFTYIGENHIDASIELMEGAQADILFWNESEQMLTMYSSLIIGRDGQLSIGYGDVSDARADYTIKAELRREGALCKITSAALANHKHFTMDMLHTCAHTSGEMKNFAIIQEGGDYRMEACGRILKGAHDSVSHQATRGLTLSDKQKSEVIPVLLIDENEVKASHATTLGQPDENQLYYLQSRGLSRQRALGLLTLGYLMPITEVLKEEKLQQMLQEKIEEKVIRNV